MCVCVCLYASMDVCVDIHDMCLYVRRYVRMDVDVSVCVYIELIHHWTLDSAFPPSPICMES